MVPVLTLKVVGMVAWAFGFTLATIDPVWATPINTLLLLLTLIAGYFLNRKTNRIEDKADRNHETSTHAANAAASAAQSAAEAARITKELGGEVRDARKRAVPMVPPTDPTDTTDEGGQ